jgi:ribosomal protein S18 acetylase RimI-like enzyme
MNIRIDPFLLDKLIDQIACVYQLAFAGPPWHESWSIDTIISDFKREMIKPGATYVVAEMKNRVIGFAWGYTVSSNNPDLDVHLDAPGLHGQLGLDSDYFYLDECAVLPEHQGNGVGKQLVSAILAAQQHTEVLLRTKDGSPMYHLITRMGGGTIQHISEERVIMRVILA